MMNTPLKCVGLSIVRNRLSPRTPNILSSSSSPRYCGNLSLKRSTSLRKSTSSRRLKFFQENLDPRKTFLNVNSSPKFTLNGSRNLLQNPTNSSSLYINTPIKGELMKNGPPQITSALDILGKGAFGTVVKGLYKNKLTAVKIVALRKHGDIPSDANAKELCHPNIVKIMEINLKPHDKYALIIMEYLELARDLQSILDDFHELSEIVKMKYIQDVCTGLQYCHNNLILHLDLKPKNILVHQNSQCKICDFGNSFRIGSNKPYHFQGTVSYAAPELLRGKEPTSKCDVYSLGITIWQIKYRIHPYDGWSDNECILYNVVKNNIRPECGAESDLFTILFQSCWNENPCCRPDIEEILKYL